MTKILTTALVASTILMAGGDIAQIDPQPTQTPDNSSFYVGGAYTYLDSTYTDNEYGDSLDNNENGLTILGGYNFNQYVAVEGRYTWGFGDDFTYKADGHSDTIDGSDGTTTAWGVYVKPQYPVTEDISVYALIGVAGVSVDAFGDKVIDNETDFSWGLGAKYAVTQNIEVFADYVSLHNGDITDVDGYTFDGDVYTANLGLNYKF